MVLHILFAAVVSMYCIWVNVSVTLWESAWGLLVDITAPAPKSRHLDSAHMAWSWCCKVLPSSSNVPASRESTLREKKKRQHLSWTVGKTTNKKRVTKSIIIIFQMSKESSFFYIIVKTITDLVKCEHTMRVSTWIIFVHVELSIPRHRQIKHT